MDIGLEAFDMDHASLDQLGGPKGVSADPPYVGPMAHNCPHLSLSIANTSKYKWNLLLIKYVHVMLFFL